MIVIDFPLKGFGFVNYLFRVVERRHRERVYLQDNGKTTVSHCLGGIIRKGKIQNFLNGIRGANTATEDQKEAET
jgi:hypothetical protein